MEAVHSHSVHAVVAADIRGKELAAGLAVEVVDLVVLVLEDLVAKCERKHFKIIKISYFPR